MIDHIEEATNEFAWYYEGDSVHLTRSGELWMLRHFSIGRLQGPSRCTYQATHRQAKLAAWDVLSRVTSVSHSQDTALEVAMRSARWMRDSSMMKPSS